MLITFLSCAFNVFPLSRNTPLLFADNTKVKRNVELHVADVPYNPYQTAILCRVIMLCKLYVVLFDPVIISITVTYLLMNKYVLL